MAALDFPASPTDGQVYGNWIYSTAKGAWKAKPLTPGQAQPSATPPANPSNGDQWYNTIDGVLYIYYNDGNSSQWVESRSAITSDGYYSPNYIINGAFDVWQRGTTPFTSAHNSYTADRWICYTNTNGSSTFSRQTFAAGESLAVGAESYFRYARTTAGTGETFNNLVQWVEGVHTLAGKTVNISFWAKADATRTVNVIAEQQFGTGGSGAGQTAFGSVTLGTTWTRFSVTGVIPSVSGKTIGANSKLGVVLQMPFNTAFTIDLFGVQLEEGSTATPFRRNANSIQGELAACQRYYWRWSANGVANSENTMALGIWVSGTTARIYVQHPVRMRTPAASVGQSSMYISDQVTSSNALTSFTTDSQRNSVDNTHLVCAQSGNTFTTKIPAALVAMSTTAWVEINAEL